jgi:RNA polymerase sigma-70 factor (ECF subfamily)
LTADRWLSGFHSGDRAVLEQCYRDHYRTVAAAASRLLSSVDAETVTHEVFYRLLSDAEMRASFRGGSLAGWLVRVTTNSAIDHLRRARRERPSELEEHAGPASNRAAARLEEELEAKWLVARFRRECLPPEWVGVFETRFLRQLPQRQAAKELGMHRTTLVYQEQRIRDLLEKFLLGASKP